MATDVLKVQDAEIKLGVVNPAVMLERAKEMGVEIDTSQPFKKQVKKFAEHFIDTVPGGVGGSLGSCMHCGSPIDVALDPCPFCGLLDGEENAPKAKVESADADREAGIAEATRLFSEAAEVLGKPEKPEPKKANANGHANGSTANEKSTPADLVKANEVLLDEKVAEILRLKATAAISGWKMGQIFGDILRRDLWKARTKNEKAVHKSFDEFVKAETGISHRHARILYDSSEQYTEAQMTKLGHKKALLLLPAPDDKRAALVEQVLAEDMTSAKVREIVTEAREEHQARTGKAPVRATKRENEKGSHYTTTSREARENRPIPKKTEMVTVAFKKGTSTVVPLFEEGDKEKPATYKSLASKSVDKIYGYGDAENKVRIRAEIVEIEKGQLGIKFRMKRIEKKKPAKDE